MRFVEKIVTSDDEMRQWWYDLVQLTKKRPVTLTVGQPMCPRDETVTLEKGTYLVEEQKNVQGGHSFFYKVTDTEAQKIIEASKASTEKAISLMKAIAEGEEI